MHTALSSEFWTDPRIEALDAGEKLAALWLMSNPSRDLLGFTKASDRRFQFETDLPPTTLQGVIKALPTTFQAPSEGVYFAAKFLRRQYGKGGKISPQNNVIRSAIRHAKTLPTPLRGAFLKAYPELEKHIAEGAGAPPQAEGGAKPPPSPHSIPFHSTPSKKEEGNDLVSEREDSAGQIAARVMALRPEWSRPPRLDAAEMRELSDNLATFQALDGTDWHLLRRFLAAKVPQGAAYWQPKRRSQLLASPGDVLSHALRWQGKGPRKPAAAHHDPGLK